MLNNYEVYRRVGAMNMSEEDGKLWMALLNRNGICEVDTAKKTARICRLFDDEPLSKECLYSHVRKVNDYLIFAPARAEKIAVYNLRMDSVAYIPLKPLEQEGKENSGEAKFWNIIQYQSEVYLLGYSYPAIIKINVESMEVTYISDWVETVEEYIEYGDICGYFSEGYVFVEDKVLIPVGCMKAVLKLDLKKACTELIKLNISMSGIGGIASSDGKHIWMVGKGSRTNRVSCWNMETDQIIEYRLDDIDENMLEPFHAPICIGNKVFLLPIAAECVYEISIDRGMVKKNTTLERSLKDVQNSIWPWWKTMAQRLKDNVLMFVTCGDFKWHEYNIDRDEVQSYFVHLTNEDEEIERYFSAIYLEKKKEKEALVESEMALKCFVYQVWNEVNKNRNTKNEKLIGGKMYQQIKGNI